MHHGNGTHWRMPDRHIRTLQDGDEIDSFKGRPRVIKHVQRNRQGGKIITFEDGYAIDASIPIYDNFTVLAFRPRLKMRDGYRDKPNA